MASGGNLLLSLFDAADLDILVPHMEWVRIAQGDLLVRANQPIEHIYFLESGIASLLAARPGERRAGVGIIGREGLCGAAALLEAGSAAHDVVLQVENDRAHRVPVEVMLRLMEDRPAIRRLMLRYVQTLFVQLGSNAAANLSDRLDIRLARWLLMCHDRVDDDLIAMTHEATAIMIGSQRTAVTGALHLLEGDRLIQGGRGVIRIVDRGGLEARAQNTYGVAEAEYRRLLTRFGKSADA